MQSVLSLICQLRAALRLHDWLAAQCGFLPPPQNGTNCTIVTFSAASLVTLNDRVIRRRRSSTSDEEGRIVLADSTRKLSRPWKG